MTLSGRAVAAIALAIAVVCGAVAGVVLVNRADQSTGQPQAGSSSPVPPTNPAGPSSSIAPTIERSLLPTVLGPTEAPTIGTTTTPSGDFPAVFDRVRSGTVRVLASTCAGTGIGTGFLLDERTVLTALPTVARAVSVAVVVDGKPVPATVQAESRGVGFAALRLARAVPGHRFEPVPTTPKPGDTVGIIGLPGQQRASALRTATVVATDATTSGNRVSLKGLVGLSGAADLGLSGAPMVDGAGRAIGMVVAPRGRSNSKPSPGPPCSPWTAATARTAAAAASPRVRGLPPRSPAMRRPRSGQPCSATSTASTPETSMRSTRCSSPEC